MMKRVLAALLSCCLAAFLLPMPVFATASTYDLDELDMCVDIPPEHVVFTRDMEDGDPNLSAYGWTKDELSSFMRERNMYLNAWDEDVNYEIVITMVEGLLVDFAGVGDTALNALASMLSTEYESTGITCMESYVYQHSQAKFIRMHMSQPNQGDTVYGLQYYTIYDGKAISVTLHSYSGTIDAQQRRILKTIVDSIRFGTDPQLRPPLRTEAFSYTDPDSGMSFTVPDNWVETPMSGDAEFLDVRFTSTLDEGLSILFSSEDLFQAEEVVGEITGVQRLLLDRSEYGNDLLTRADVAEMYGCEEADVSMVTYGGREYFMAQSVVEGEVYGIPVSMPMTRLVRCENAYLYVFHFNGSRSSEHFRDLRSLMNSVEYPDFEGERAARELVVGSWLVLAVLVLIALCLLPVFIWRSRKKKRIKRETERSAGEDAMEKPEDTPVAHGMKREEASVGKPCEEVTEEGQSAAPAEEGKRQRERAILFCHRCGSRLGEDDSFCSQCGTKIPGTRDNGKMGGAGDV